MRLLTLRSGILTTMMLAALAARSTASEPWGTGFTYQGQLKQAGVAVNNSADFEFSLWDAVDAGNQVGATVPRNNVNVVNGLFTVGLDFGAGAFIGEARWLGIAVRSPAGDGNFTTLTPRQPLTAPPHPQAADAGANAGYGYVTSVSGLVGYLPVFEDCLESEVGINCAGKRMFTVAVQGGMANLDIVQTVSDGQGGHLDVTTHFSFEKQPRTGVPEVRAFDIVGTVHRGEDTLTFTLAPDDPSFVVRDPNGFIFTARLISDDLVAVAIDANTLRFVTTESIGIIQSATVEPYTSDARTAVLSVDITNYGDLKTNYMVTVTDCPSHIAPVMSQAVVLEPTQVHTFDFAIRANAPFTGDDECLVSLKSPDTGRLYDEVPADFPEPTP